MVQIEQPDIDRIDGIWNALLEPMPRFVVVKMHKATVVAVALHIELALQRTEGDPRTAHAASGARLWLDELYGVLARVSPRLPEAITVAGQLDLSQPSDAAMVDAIRNAVDRSNEETILRRWFEGPFSQALREVGSVVDAMHAYRVARACGASQHNAIRQAISSFVWAVLNPEMAATAKEDEGDEGRCHVPSATERLAKIRERLESIVCTSGCDAGLVLLDVQGTTHRDEAGREVYDHVYFSPLGDALMEVYNLTAPDDVAPGPESPAPNPAGESCDQP